METVSGKTVAFMVAAGFNETEFTELQRTLVKEGAKLLTIAPENGVVNGWQGAGWGHYFPVDRQLPETLAADLDMVIVPGGERAFAKLSQNLHAKRILTHAVDAMMPVVLFSDAAGLLPIAERTAEDGHVMVVETLEGEWVPGVMTHLMTEIAFEEEERVAA